MLGAHSDPETSRPEAIDGQRYPSPAHQHCNGSFGVSKAAAVASWLAKREWTNEQTHRFPLYSTRHRPQSGALTHSLASEIKRKITFQTLSSNCGSVWNRCEKSRNGWNPARTFPPQLQIPETEKLRQQVQHFLYCSLDIHHHHKMFQLK